MRTFHRFLVYPTQCRGAVILNKWSPKIELRTYFLYLMLETVNINNSLKTLVFMAAMLVSLIFKAFLEPIRAMEIVNTAPQDISDRHEMKLRPS
jgi:hypothetical protein